MVPLWFSAKWRTHYLGPTFSRVLFCCEARIFPVFTEPHLNYLHKMENGKNGEYGVEIN